MILVAIDGRSAAGKSRLAAEIAKETGAFVLHMDDYFRPRHQHVPGPGGNMDLMRFRREVLEPLAQGRDVITWPFDCTRQERTDPVRIPKEADLVIVEGAYSMHPDLGDPWDFRVFMDIDPKTQKERILARNGQEKARQFETVWIPREEEYLQMYSVRDACDMVLGCENGKEEKKT